MALGLNGGHAPSETGARGLEIGHCFLLKG